MRLRGSFEKRGKIKQLNQFKLLSALTGSNVNTDLNPLGFTPKTCFILPLDWRQTCTIIWAGSTPIEHFFFKFTFINKPAIPFRDSFTRPVRDGARKITDPLMDHAMLPGNTPRRGGGAENWRLTEKCRVYWRHHKLQPLTGPSLWSWRSLLKCVSDTNLSIHLLLSFSL